jgi:hypothetical protein
LINYNYLERYFFSGTLRRDGSSRFIGVNQWGTFGSVGFSWLAHKEDFLIDVDVIDFLKFKTSYGLVGEQAGVGRYPGYDTFNISNLNDNISISERTIGNPDLTWETSKMFQIGAELSLLNKLDINLDYYLKNTDNLLFDRRVGPSVGFALITVNDGQLKNQGLEFDIAYHAVETKDFKLDVSVNGAFIKNELTAMPIDPATGQQKTIDIDGRFGRSKGHSLFDFYVREWAGVDPKDGASMWYQHYHDENSNGIVDPGEAIASLHEFQSENPDIAVSKTLTKSWSDATQKYVNKSAIPKISGAFRLSATYKQFDLSTQFTYSLGGHAYDSQYAGLMGNDNIGANNWHTDIRNRWKEPGDITNVPRLANAIDTNVSSTSTRFITSSDYLALNNVRLGYYIPKFIEEKIGAKIKLFVTADNLMFLSARNGFNPSTAEDGTSSRYNYSPLTNVTFGTRIQF